MRPNWPHPGCVGLWHLDGDCADSSGEGHNGTNSGGAAFQLGKWGQSTYVLEDYWFLGYPACLRVADFTVSAWYKSNVASSRAAIYSTSGVYVGPSYYIHYGYSLDAHSSSAGLCINGELYTGNATVVDGKWHFLMATRDDDYVRLYVDGRLDKWWSYSPAIEYCGNYPAGYYYAGSYIGAAYWKALGAYPTGWIDEVMVENYAIEPEEALNRYLFQIGEL